MRTATSGRATAEEVVMIPGLRSSVLFAGPARAPARRAPPADPRPTPRLGRGGRRASALRGQKLVAGDVRPLDLLAQQSRGPEQVDVRRDCLVAQAALRRNPPADVAE